MDHTETYPPQEQSATPPTDEALMRIAQEGDTAGFERLVGRYQSKLYNYLRHMVGNAADAQDLFQETFLRVFKHLRDFRTDAAFRPWLYSIATNAARDHLRAARRRPRVLPDTASNGGDASAIERVAAPTPTPLAYAQEHETAQRLQEAVGRLHAKQRAVFLMARYDGLSYDEIARALRIPVGTVRSRMNKAVHFLMDALEDQPS